LATKEKKGKSQNAIQQFFRETSGELRKVSWPTWPEAYRLTVLVLLVMVLMGIILGVVDVLSHNGLNMILGIA